MKAAVLEGIRKLTVKDVKTPAVKKETMLISVKAASICGSDLKIFNYGNKRVKYPAIIGHEISGEVAAVGDSVKNFKMGDRVSLGADIPCMRCYWCSNGLANCCDENLAIGYQFDGGFAEYCLLQPLMVRYGPIAKIPNNLSYEEACLAEPLACILNGLEMVNISKGKSVLIIGAGPIGCMLISAVKLFEPCKIIVSEINPSRLKKAEEFKADFYINSNEENLIEAVKENTEGRMADVVFTATPSVYAQGQAIQAVAKRGCVNLFAGVPNNSSLCIDPNLVHYKECSIVGSHGSVPRQHKNAVELISKGKIKVSELITHEFALGNIHKAFQVVKKMQGLKIIIKPN